MLPVHYDLKATILGQSRSDRVMFLRESDMRQTQEPSSAPDAPSILLCVLLVVMFQLPASPGFGQEGVEPADRQDKLKLNLPPNTELRVLIDYVSQRLGENILFDESIAGTRVTILAPSEIPADSLMGLLESVLRMKNLTLIDAEQPGWKRIVQTTDAAAVRPDEDAAAGPSRIVTRVFELEHADSKTIEAMILPMLSKPGGNALSLQDHGVLVVTDYVDLMRRIEGVIALADRPGPAREIRFIPVEHIAASELAPQVAALFDASTDTRGVHARQRDQFSVESDPRTNQLILIGVGPDLDAAGEIAKQLDVEVERQTVVYECEVAPPQRIDNLVKALIGPERIEQVYRSTIDAEAGLLVVTTTPPIHDQVIAIKASLDVPVAEQQSPIRFYALKNATAKDVLGTLQSLIDSNIPIDRIAIDAATSSRGTARSQGQGTPERGAGLDGVRQEGVQRVEGDLSGNRDQPGPIGHS